MDGQTEWTFPERILERHLGSREKSEKSKKVWIGTRKSSNMERGLRGSKKEPWETVMTQRG
jgi:hypothetical protein